MTKDGELIHNKNMYVSRYFILNQCGKLLLTFKHQIKGSSNFSSSLEIHRMFSGVNCSTVVTLIGKIKVSFNPS